MPDGPPQNLHGWRSIEPNQPIGAEVDAESRSSSERKKTAGKAVVGMEILGRGALRNRQDDARFRSDCWTPS
jgi:hypothetical protein